MHNARRQIDRRSEQTVFFQAKQARVTPLIKESAFAAIALPARDDGIKNDPCAFAQVRHVPAGSRDSPNALVAKNAPLRGEQSGALRSHLSGVRISHPRW